MIEQIREFRRPLLMVVVGFLAVWPASPVRADIRVINNSDSPIEACIRYTRGQYSSNSGFGGGGSATMSISSPDSIVEGWFVIPEGSPGSIPTPGNGDISVYLRAGGRDIIPDTATDNGTIHAFNVRERFVTINGMIDGHTSVSTPNEAARLGFVRKRFYRVDVNRPVTIFGNFRPATAPSPIRPAQYGSVPNLELAPPMGNGPMAGPRVFTPSAPAPFRPLPAVLAGRTFRAFATGSVGGVTLNNNFCGWYRFEPNGLLVQILPAGVGTLTLGRFTQRGESLSVAMGDGSRGGGTVSPNGFFLNLSDGGSPFSIRGEP